jgi:hypothetical protein
MTDIGSSIMVASMIVGMLTVPAASKTINSSSTVSADLPNISSSDTLPEEVSTNSSSESFTRRVETAFQEFETTISSESAETSVESADSRLDIQKTPEQTVWKLKSSEGQLVITQSSSQTVEEVETPYGSLKTKRVNGGVQENFEGSSREKVESAAEELRSLMYQKKNKIEQRKTRTQVDQYSRNIEIEGINKSKDFVVIDSQMSRQISLEDWKISDEVKSHEFGSVSIPAEGELVVYSDSQAEVEAEEEEGVNHVYDTNIAWNQESSGDTATLWKNGEEVAEKSY